MTKERSEEEQAALDHFEDCKQRYAVVAKELEQAANKLRRYDFYPSPPEGVRFRLADERQGSTHKFKLGTEDSEVKVYVTPGVYSDGKLGEIFLRAAKQGSLTSGLLDSFGTLFSIALQYGVPVERLIDKFKHVRFEPAGYNTSGGEIRKAGSLIDYIAQWLELRHTDRHDQQEEPDDIPDPA